MRSVSAADGTNCAIEIDCGSAFGCRLLDANVTPDQEAVAMVAGTCAHVNNQTTVSCAVS